MRKRLLFISCVLVFVSAAFGQVKPKTTTKPAVSPLKKIVSDTGLPFEMINDSLAVVPFEGQNIASYQVIVQKVSDLYIVYTNLTETLPGKIDATKYEYLLQRNNDFDIVKAGVDDADKTVYLRADVFRSNLNAALLKRVINQVANVTNIIAGDLK